MHFPAYLQLLTQYRERYGQVYFLFLHRNLRALEPDSSLPCSFCRYLYQRNVDVKCYQTRTTVLCTQSSSCFWRTLSLPWFLQSLILPKYFTSSLLPFLPVSPCLSPGPTTAAVMCYWQSTNIISHPQDLVWVLPLHLANNTCTEEQHFSLCQMLVVCAVLAYHTRE